jgi:competence protein ComEC
LSVCILLTSFFWGPRGVVILLPVCWAVLSAAWVIEDRLAEELHGKDLQVTGVVCDIPRTDKGIQRFLLAIDVHERVPGLPARVLLSWYETDMLVRAGERWRLTIRLKRPRGARNPAGFDFERWAFMRNIGAVGYVRHSLSNRRLSVQGCGCELAAYRQGIATDLTAAIPDGRALGHLLALTVGIRHQLNEADWDVLRRTGTAHLMAISGLHIGLAAGFAFFCCRQLGCGLLIARIACRPLVIARVGALVGAVSYSALAGFSVPTVRAMVMASVVILLTGLRRTMPLPAVLGAALYAVLWVSPLAMLAAGFWLSFGAVFVLLLSGFSGISGVRVRNEPRTRTRKALLWARQLLRAQICLSAGMMPATAFFFGQVSVVAPVANLLVVPVFALLFVPLLMIGIMLLIVLPELASPVLRLVDAILNYLVGFLAVLSHRTPAAFDVPEFTALTAGACGVMALVLIWPRPLPARNPALMLLIALTAIAATRSVAPGLRVVVMDVGQGLAVLLQTPDYAVLYDTGPRYRDGDAGRSIVIPVLRHFGVTQLEHLIVSHGDADHAGGVRSILSVYPQAGLTASARLDVPAERFYPCRAGQYWHRDGIRFQFLHPGPADESEPWSENDASCVLLVQTAQAGLLLSGDIERRAERRIVAGGTLPVVDLVVAPHHGSRTSSSPSFVAATRPDFVVFSAGYRNRWRFPAPEVLDRWLAFGACALTTGHTGALVFETNSSGSLLLVKRYRLDEARIWNETGPFDLLTSRCRPSDSTN